MSVAEHELVDQFTGFGDREPFELPKANEDVKLGRYLFTAANHITPTIARERPHMKAGGLNVLNPCLNQSRDFIRRGRLVPLLINQHMPVPIEEANTENSDYFHVPPDGESLKYAHLQGPLEATGMMSRAAYPGQQIAHILEGSSNVDGAGRRIGIVEIETLKGHEYKLVDIGGGFRTDPDLWKIQKAIFPDYPNVPFALRPFTELIKRAIDTNQGDIRSIAKEAYPACGQFEAWAIRSIEVTHQNMGFLAQKGYSYPYEDIDLLILEQLEMERRDEHFKRLAQQAESKPQPQLDPQSLVAMMRETGKENREMFMEALSVLKQEWELDRQTRPDENTMKEKPLHWKTREKIEREAAANSESQAGE